MADKKEKTNLSEDKKLDIEDIKDPGEEEPARSEDHSGGDIDIDEVVSEPKESKLMPDEEAENTEQGDLSTDVSIDKAQDKQDDNKSPGEPEKAGINSDADKDVLEEAVEESKSEKIKKEAVLEETTKKKKSGKTWWKTALIILATILVTAALALGAVWWYMTRNASQKSEESRPETKTEEPKKVETTQTTGKTVYVSPAEGLRLRKEPNPNAEILATMPQGTKLTVLDTQGEWIKTTFEGKTGWCLSTYTSAENPLIYKNTQYGFQITFPQVWAGYKFFEKNVDGAIVLYLGLPTTQAGWTSTGVDVGYSSMFAIEVYTKAQWTTVNAQEGPKPVKLGEKGDYVFAWSQAQSTPKDLEKRFSEIKSVIDTFKTL